MPLKTKIAVLSVVVVALIGFNTSKVITRPNEYSVITQFGSIKTVHSEPGLAFKVPFLQQTKKLPNEVLLYDLPVSDVITQDKKTMVADSFALWQIEDPRLFVQTLHGSVPDAEARISTLLYNVMKNTISAMPQSEVISGRDGALAEAIKNGMGDSLERYGIKLIAVETKHLDLPSDNKEAIFQRMISERENIAAAFIAEGEKEAQKIRSQADKEAEIMIGEAQADAEKLRAEGEAEYMRLLSNAYNDPAKADFYGFVRRLDAAKESFKNGNKTLFLDPDSPVAKVFFEN